MDGLNRSISLSQQTINMLVLQLMFGSLLLHLGKGSGSGRHSLWVMASYISGPTQFPEFSAVVMLDDIQVGYYDSQDYRLTRCGSGGEKGAELGLGQEPVFVLQEIFSSMRRRLNLAKDQLNLTSAGVHVQQRLTGCEVQDGQPALIMFRDGFNGQDADCLQYNMTHFSYGGGDGWDFHWSNLKTAYFQTLYADIFMPFCARTLQHLLDRQKHAVMRRVKPRVRLMTKRVEGGAKVTCLATEFYPRHINLTLLRDDAPVDEGELTGGEVLPNANGLYQARKTLMVDEEELQRGHRYTCAASHLSLDNRLDVSWRAESSRSNRVHVISVPVGLAVAAILLLVLLSCRRRGRAQGVAMETQEHL